MGKVTDKQLIGVKNKCFMERARNMYTDKFTDEQYYSQIVGGRKDTDTEMDADG